MSAQDNVAPTSFINVQVVAIPQIDPTTGKVTYQTTFNPEVVEVYEDDTVINYQIIEPTPTGVVFTGMTVCPEHTHQFSHPSVSQSGKLITFSDANTLDDTLNITLQFIDKDSVEFNVDPEVINNPR